MAKKQTTKHKVFISFHEKDIKYKEDFVRMMGKRIVDRSVDTGNIDDTGLKTATVRQKIRDEYIRDATVTIVLIGPRTWQRRHVDWEIGSSIRKTRKNPRCGLLGIVLPNHPNHGKRKNLDPHLIPPRLADNWTGDDSYALIYDWPEPWAPAQVAEWIHRAFVRRDGIPPNNSRSPFALNRTRDYKKGWQN
ncbi:MAG: TIR domain-containing protein [Chloroflexota bacterium]|nr:TIR domain-containing protein [Chloroflexota bacterium]